MAINCSACEELREQAPVLFVSGIGDDECTSLQNNTGINSSSGNDDYTDLSNMNDCLIGNLISELDAYDDCDWKSAVKTLVTNLWSINKAQACIIKGLWTHIEELEG